MYRSYMYIQCICCSICTLDIHCTLYTGSIFVEFHQRLIPIQSIHVMRQAASMPQVHATIVVYGRIALLAEIIQQSHKSNLNRETEKLSHTSFQNNPSIWHRTPIIIIIISIVCQVKANRSLSTSLSLLAFQAKLFSLLGRCFASKNYSYLSLFCLISLLPANLPGFCSRIRKSSIYAQQVGMQI